MSKVLSRNQKIKQIVPFSVRLFTLYLLWQVFIGARKIYRGFFINADPALTHYIYIIAILLIIIILYLILRPNIKYIYFLTAFFVLELILPAFYLNTDPLFVFNLILYIFFIHHLWQILRPKENYRDDKKFIRADKILSFFVAIKLAANSPIFWLSIIALLSMLGFDINWF